MLITRLRPVSKVGEGCFQLNDAKGKNVSVEVDTNTNKVKFTFVE